MNEKVKDFFQKSLGYIIVAIVAIVYVSTAFIQIDDTGKSVGQIIVDGAVVFLFGFFINRIFDLQGIMNGERDERFRASMSIHGDTVMRISPYIDKLDEWCRLKNEENLRVQRTRILAFEGLRYSDYFNEDGSAKEFTVDEKKLESRLLRRAELRRKHCFYKALHLKLTPLSAGVLTSDGDKMQDPYNFGRTKEQYERQTSVSDLISKVVVALIFGYYGVSLVRDFSYAKLIWNALQAALFVLIGSVNMYNSQLFITGEYRNRIVKKINHLEMFDNYIKALSEESTETKETEENKL